LLFHGFLGQNRDIWSKNFNMWYISGSKIQECYWIVAQKFKLDDLRDLSKFNSWTKNTVFDTLCAPKSKNGEKRNDRVSTLDSWTTKRWSGAHHQLFFSVNNDLSTGCEKQSEKIKLRLLLLWGCCRFFEKWRHVVGTKFVYTCCPQEGGVRNRLFMKSLFDSRFLSSTKAEKMLICCAESHLKNIQ